jgi:transcriptional regulator with XRE-family HTH domain
VKPGEQKPLRATLAHNLRRLRKRLGWSQDRVAAAAKLNRTYYAEIEGCRRNCGIDTIEKIARAFDVDTIELFLAGRPEAPHERPIDRDS